MAVASIRVRLGRRAVPQHHALRGPQARIPCSGSLRAANVRHHIYGHGSHHGHGHGHGHPEGEEFEPWRFPKDADPRSFFQPPEPERPDIALHVRVELAGSIRELAAQHPETQADIEAALHGYVDRLSTCRGVLSTALLQHYESLRETLSVDERGLGPGTYACHLHF